MKIHFIAIGGSVMHSLAIALKNQGHEVTGSDDHIFDPSRGRLSEAGLLPEKEGWFPDKLHAALDAVIVGMHAKEDNPELKKASELGLKLYSYPEFIYQHSINQQRIVVAGSHGKSTVSSMILHVLQTLGRDFDYVVGAVPKTLDSSVRLSQKAPVIIIEGDEYPTSPLDKTPKFLKYKHHIGVITGIAWDHYNVYPNYDEYVDQFRQFAESSPKAGALVYNKTDKPLDKLVKKAALRDDVLQLPYSVPKSKLKNGVTSLSSEVGTVPLKVFGEHNLLNIGAALEVCSRIGVPKEQFYKAISSFEGARLRLDLLGEAMNGTKVYRDFAHAPSKVKATVEAVKKQFGKQQLVACVELHTYSSLNKEFISQYKDTLKKADRAMVYYNPETVARKGLSPISAEELRKAFNNNSLEVFTDKDTLQASLTSQAWGGKNLLLMSSGNFDSLGLEALAKRLTA